MQEPEPSIEGPADLVDWHLVLDQRGVRGESRTERADDAAVAGARRLAPMLLVEHEQDGGRRERHRYEAYLHQRRVLKPQLDALVKLGLAVSLRDYMQRVSEVWRHSSYVTSQRAEPDET